MSDVQLVKYLEPAPVRLQWSCHCCPHRVSALSDAGLKHAMDDHSAYVNATADRATNPHFDDVRLNALIAP